MHTRFSIGIKYLILIQEHVELPDTDSKISLIELVGDIPA